MHYEAHLPSETGMLYEHLTSIVSGGCFFRRGDSNRVESINTIILKLQLFITTRQRRPVRDSGILMAADIRNHILRLVGSIRMESVHAHSQIFPN